MIWLQRKQASFVQFMFLSAKMKAFVMCFSSVALVFYAHLEQFIGLFANQFYD